MTAAWDLEEIDCGIMRQREEDINLYVRENERNWNGERWQIGCDAQTLDVEEGCLQIRQKPESRNRVWEWGEEEGRKRGRAYLGTVQLLCWRRKIRGKGRGKGKKQKGKLASKAPFKIKCPHLSEEVHACKVQEKPGKNAKKRYSCYSPPLKRKSSRHHSWFEKQTVLDV